MCANIKKNDFGFQTFHKNSDFRHILKKVSGKQTLDLALRQYLESELFGNRTVIGCLKSILVQILDTHCSLGLFIDFLLESIL